ncbi:sensor histidine kinase [Methanobacterium sp. MBAC-LM]|uniref:sensor histidine kinase n=1 Tax=Methanobacterium sp. MBAC-LM TaxID=3412034 RepID=UPI003C7364DF
MDLNNSITFRANLKRFSEILSIVIIIIGFIIFIGWAFNIPLLKSPGPDFPTIKFNSALCFILIGASLWLQQTKRINKRNRHIAQVLAVIVLSIGLIALIEHLFNFNLGIDQILFTEPFGTLETSSPNRIAFIGAIEYIITGAALLIIDKKINKRFPTQYLMILGSIISLMVLLGYLYDASEFYQISHYTATSIYAGIGFMLISFAVLIARPETCFMKVLTSGEYGSIFGLRILFVLTSISIVFGWLRILGQYLGYYDTAFGTVLYTLSVLIILSIFVWSSILSLNKTDRERKEANNELKKNLEELERSNKELKSFAHITSHDLQEPLRTITSYSQLIERRYKRQLDPDADEFLEYMVSDAKRMKSMIQGLLDYSHVEAKGKEFKEINTEKALNTALSNLQYSIDQCHAEVTHDPLPPVFADENQIVSVFQNLIDNALKFRKKDEIPKIHISAKKDDNEWIFSVKDNGIGIEDKYFDIVFEVFKRLHAIGEYEGAGIGLAIAKRIIDRHGGHIWVESSPGKGSKFYFTIPLVTEPKSVQ